MSTERVTSPDWSPANPWTELGLGDVVKDAAGGPTLERVTKICRDARGFDRLRGCGKRFEGWVIAAGPIPRKVIGMLPPKFRQQLTEPDGAIWGLCDSCLRKIEALRTPVVAVQPVAVRRPARVGEGF